MEAGTVAAMVMAVDMAAVTASAAAEVGIISVAAVGAILVDTSADIAADLRAIRSGERISAEHISAGAGLWRVTQILARCGMPRLRRAMPAMP